MKKILLLIATVFAFAGCDPTHEDISNGGHITVDELKAKSTVVVDKSPDGQNGNVVTCQTSAPVNAKWTIAGKDLIGNYAWKKMKLGDHVVVLTAICPDGTELKAEYPITCSVITNALEKYYIYGDPAKTDEVPFQPGAWDAAAMRFSSTEGAHFPTIPDDVYFGFKTLILDVSDASPDCKMCVMNGWWSNWYFDTNNGDKAMPLSSGLTEFTLYEQLAKECAKGNGGEGRDLQFMLTSGSCTVNSVYYEE